MTQYGLFLWVLYASFVPGLRMYLFNAILAFSRCRYGLVWSPAVLLVRSWRDRMLLFRASGLGWLQ